MLNPSIRFSPANIAALKKALRGQYPHIKSSHLDEAIAASFGFKSYAAMHPALYQLVAYAGLVVESVHLLLLLRLEELGIETSPRSGCVVSSGISNSPMTGTTAKPDMLSSAQEADGGQCGVARASITKPPTVRWAAETSLAALAPCFPHVVISERLHISGRYALEAAKGSPGKLSDASMTGVQSKHCEANLFPR
ncbi:hypothetical protein [Rhizobium sp. 12,4]|uniref:hypothetical protein n=1 Tax=Rhizobium sp. 12,4 TaxID=3405135 RepID=UPI003D350309